MPQPQRKNPGMMMSLRRHQGPRYQDPVELGPSQTALPDVQNTSSPRDPFPAKSERKAEKEESERKHSKVVHLLNLTGDEAVVGKIVGAMGKEFNPGVPSYDCCPIPGVTNVLAKWMKNKANRFTLYLYPMPYDDPKLLTKFKRAHKELGKRIKQGADGPYMSLTVAEVFAYWWRGGIVWKLGPGEISKFTILALAVAEIIELPELPESLLFPVKDRLDEIDIRTLKGIMLAAGLDYVFDPDQHGGLPRASYSKMYGYHLSGVSGNSWADSLLRLGPGDPARGIEGRKLITITEGKASQDPNERKTTVVELVGVKFKHTGSGWTKKEVESNVR